MKIQVRAFGKGPRAVSISRAVGSLSVTAQNTAEAEMLGPLAYMFQFDGLPSVLSALAWAITNKALTDDDRADLARIAGAAVEQQRKAASSETEI